MKLRQMKGLVRPVLIVIGAVLGMLVILLVISSVAHAEDGMDSFCMFPPFFSGLRRFVRI